MGLRADLDKLM